MKKNCFFKKIKNIFLFFFPLENFSAKNFMLSRCRSGGHLLLKENKKNKKIFFAQFFIFLFSFRIFSTKNFMLSRCRQSGGHLLLKEKNKNLCKKIFYFFPFKKEKTRTRKKI